jgi:capsular polysaccharide biosynthesis protein
MELELKDILRIIRKRYWILIVLTMFIAGVTALYTIFFITPMYQASVKLIVSDSKAIDLNGINTNIKLTQTYMEIIKTTSMMESVAEKNPGLKMKGNAIKSLVSVSTVKDTQIMTITVKHKSQKKAAEIANAVAKTSRIQLKSIMKVDNVRIIDNAIVNKSAKPISPNLEANLMTSLLVSLILGIGIIFLIEYFDDTIKTEEDISRYLKLPTISTIMSIDQDEYTMKSDKAKKTKEELK